MHIVIVNAVFPPEPVVSAKIGLDLAKHLCSCGHTVTVLCPYPTRPLSASYSVFSGRNSVCITHEDYGASIVRLPSYTSPKSRLLGRIYESWSFGRYASLYLKNDLREFDIVYANTWPFFSQWWLAVTCKKLNTPLIFHIQDLYPESFLSRLPSWVARCLSPLLFAFERFVSHMADGVIVISEGFRTAYLTKRNLPQETVKTVMNWIDERPFKGEIDRRKACADYSLPADVFTFLFFGNIGPVAGVDLLIEAFVRANIDEAQLVIAGDGSMKEKCVKQAENFANKQIYFISDPQISATPKIQSLADVCLLPVKKGQASSSIPSKLMVYMMSGTPIVATVDEDSATASAIRESSSGWVGTPEDVAWLSEAMQDAVATSQTKLSGHGQRAKTYALETFSRENGVTQITEFLNQITKTQND